MSNLKIRLARLGLMVGATVGLFGLDPIGATPTGNLIVTVDGLNSQDGVVCIALFNNEAGFPTDGTKAIRNYCSAIATVPLAVKFDNLPFGKYAVSLIHDENQDSRLNTGIFGIPKEGVGFSNNPKLIEGTPSFEKTSFDFVQNNNNVPVKVKYF